MTAHKRPLVIGIGNPHAGDDAVGLLVAQALRRAGYDGGVVENPGIAADLISLFEGHDHVILIDACRSDAAPGTIHQFDANDAPLPPFLTPVSSHGYGVGEAVELARVLGLLPAICMVWAIEGVEFGVGTQMTPAVSRTIAKCAAGIGDISALSGSLPPHRM